MSGRLPDPPCLDSEITMTSKLRFVCSCLLLIIVAIAPASGQEAGGDPEQYVDELLEMATSATDRSDIEAVESLLAEASSLVGAWNYPEAGHLHQKIGDIYLRLGSLDHRFNFDAEHHFERSLKLLEPTGDDSLISTILFRQGTAQLRVGNYHAASLSFGRAAEIRRSLGWGLMPALANLGGAYTELGNYGQAWLAYKEALTILSESPNLDQGLLHALQIDLASSEIELGIYDSPINELKEILKQSIDQNHLRNQARAEFHLGYAYFNKGKQLDDGDAVLTSIQHSRNAVALHEADGNARSLGRSLNNLGYAHGHLGNVEEALTALNRALEIAKSEDRSNTCRTLDSVGFVYFQNDNFQQAHDHYFDALVCAQDVGSLGTEHVALAHLAQLYEDSNPNLAITFLKQSVLVVEQIREGLEPLSLTARQTYADKVAWVYRQLADLLLSEQRAVEAERAIDRMKAEELNVFLGGLRGEPGGLPQLEEEQHIWSQYAALLAEAVIHSRELASLRTIPADQRTPEQQLRFVELAEKQIAAKSAFQTLQNREDVKTALAHMTELQDFEVIELGALINISEYLLPNEVLFYPLVLDDRIELVFVTANAIPVSIPSPMAKDELYSKVFGFRQALRSRDSGVAALGQELYAALLEPLDMALAQVQANSGDQVDSIIYVPDGFLRYIPLAALHDRQDWIARRYSVSIITSTSLSELGVSPTQINRILAGAFTHSKTVSRPDGSQTTFSGLVYASREVSDLLALYPNSQVHEGDDFKAGNFVVNFEDYDAVHLATHAEFVPMQAPEFSIVLYGDGGHASFVDIQNQWLLRDVDLVTLSACETGIGGVLGNGDEIHGFGYLMQESGANAVLASLWNVSDSGTQALMSTFYRNLKVEGTSKSRALQSAQLALIDDEIPEDVEALIRGAHPVDQPPLPSDFSHPFYWSSFILIGNSR